jgi:cytochrome P450
VSSQPQIVEVLRNTALFSSRRHSGPIATTPLAQRVAADPEFDEDTRKFAARRIKLAESPMLSSADPPEHGKQRRLVRGAFNVRRVTALEPTVRQIANELVDAAMDREQFDMVSDFAAKLPVSVTAHLLGVPREMRRTFTEWTHSFITAMGAPDLSREEISRIFRNINDAYDYMTQQVLPRREHPSGDLISDLVSPGEGDYQLTLDEVLQVLVQLLVAGSEATSNLLTATMLVLLSNRSISGKLRDRALLPNFIEEVLRLEPPVQGQFRTATEDTVLGGQSIPAGSHLYLLFASANRDPSIYEHPHSWQFESDRAPSHLSFGQGEHFCLGAPLARLETRVGVETLLERMPDLELAVPPDEVQYLQSFVLHAITSLPLLNRATAPKA